MRKVHRGLPPTPPSAHSFTRQWLRACWGLHSVWRWGLARQLGPWPPAVYGLGVGRPPNKNKQEHLKKSDRHKRSDRNSWGAEKVRGHVRGFMVRWED